MNRKTTPEPAPRLPINLEPASNGEFVPPPEDPRLAVARKLAHERAEENARRLGMSRRRFLESTCGAATVLLAMNQVLGCRGAQYSVPPEAELDPDAARGPLTGDEFIFDVQTHHVSTTRPWTKSNPGMATFLSQAGGASCGSADWIDCYARDPYLKEIFLDSDTDVAVFSALWGSREMNPIHIEEMAETRSRISKTAGSPRLRIHGIVQPNDGTLDEVRERMEAAVDEWKIAAWKLYPLWGPRGKGFFLDDPALGVPTIEHGLALGLPIFAVHKGLPLPGNDPAFASARDIGRAAKLFPKATFLVYHSGFDQGHVEGPYDPAAENGVDALLAGLEENGIGKDGNVYAELGSTWRYVMRNPDTAGHLIGKLLVHLGEDRILWGTDSIWYGSPQDQIMAFRAFQISAEYREKHGYPELTPGIKAKILGLNAARVYGLDPVETKKRIRSDDLTRARTAYLEAPRPAFEAWGPRTRREVLELVRLERGQA
jgi:predicted TIM-barrel fold metal-dependent hydrolase